MNYVQDQWSVERKRECKSREEDRTKRRKERRMVYKKSEISSRKTCRISLTRNRRKWKNGRRERRVRLRRMRE